MGSLKDQGPVQLHISKHEGAEGHHRTLRRGASHIIKPLYTQPFVGSSLHHHLHLKKLRSRAGRSLAKSQSYLPNPQHPQLALFYAFQLHTWGHPLKVRETRMNLSGFIPGAI